MHQSPLVYSKEHKASYPGDRSTIGKLLPVFGKTPVTEITPQSIKAYLDTRDDLTKTTINRYRGTLSMIFQEAIRNGKVEQNPARLVRLQLTSLPPTNSRLLIDSQSTGECKNWANQIRQQSTETSIWCWPAAPNSPNSPLRTQWGFQLVSTIRNQTHQQSAFTRV